MLYCPEVPDMATHKVSKVWTFHDGGRKEAGFKGHTGDCVVRAIAIVTRKPYRYVYDEINAIARAERPRKGKKRSSARTGVAIGTIRKYLDLLGYVWVPTMKVGSGCRVHLKADELPKGRIIVRLSRHITAMIDGTIYDLYDPSREGTRCVYGYWTKKKKKRK